MCTLLIATRVEGGPPLFVIDNRDEALDRPAESPTRRRAGDRRIVAPRDKRCGGTWVGLNDAGLVAAITNRFGLPSQKHHRSRGHLVVEALECASAKEAVAKISALSPTDYNGFHLVTADDESAWVVWHDGIEFRRRELSPGFYVVTERSFGAGFSRRLKRIKSRLATLDGWSNNLRDRLRGWMGEHDDQQPLEGTCVHATEQNYGTRSSTIIELGVRHRRFRYADGPPCATPYCDFSAP